MLIPTKHCVIVVTVKSDPLSSPSRLSGINKNNLRRHSS